MTIAIIPARMNSSRFPGKPLAKIHGIPMIGHCYFRTAMSKRLDATYIATCDEEIGAYASRIGAPWIMTSASHERASDRIAEANVDVVNLMAPIDSIEDFEDPNEVKVVISPDNYAVYFSREPIPSRRKGVTDGPRLKQVCIIPFRRDYLLKYNASPQTTLEIIESVDMLRVIEMGGKIKMAMSPFDTFAVDTPDDLAFVNTLMAEDPLMMSYADKASL
jgi:3-deoxy-manno-octulosonate cytidylyltransferase (CMP-KDO synthetase)